MLTAEAISYQHSSNFSLKALNLHIQKGEIVSLIGPNGSGKSTLLRIIARLLKPKSGHVLLHGQLVHTMKSRDLAKQLSMLTQTQGQTDDLTVSELVTFGRYPYRSTYGKMTVNDTRIIDWAIKVTQLERYRNRMLHTLSGGERQRAWIAKSIAQQPDVLLLDEPTTYLDIAHQLEVMELIKELNENFGMTIVMVLHDINQAARYSDRLIVLKDGEIQYDGLPQCVLCREMFQSIFHVDAQIIRENGICVFTPKPLRKEKVYSGK